MLQVQGEASHMLASTGHLLSKSHKSHYAKGKSFKSTSILFVSLSRELTDDYSDKKKKNPRNVSNSKLPLESQSKHLGLILYHHIKFRQYEVWMI